MKKLCIAPCGNKKIWDQHPNIGPTAARFAYTGPFAAPCIRYAEYFYPDSYRILSAKYGFLLPMDIIEDYDISFNKPKTNPITLDRLIVQRDQKNLSNYDCIIALGGKKYIEILEKVFIGKKIINPLAGCKGNGEMAHKLIQAIETNTPLSDC